jgi:hypothetical protein
VKREEVEMRFRQIASALVACMALAALAAGAAQAGQWTIGTEENQTKAGTKLTGPETVKLEKHPGTELTMSTVLLGLPFSLTAGNVHCRAATSCSLSTTKEGVDQGEGALEFTEVKVSVPKCTVPGNKIVTEALTQRGLMDPTAGSTAVFDKFFTESGGPISTFIFEGAECPFLEMEVVVKGTVCGEVVHTITPGTYTPSPTGTLFKVQTLRFGKAQQATGGCSELMFGNAKAQLTGAVDNELAGTNKAKPYGAD